MGQNSHRKSCNGYCDISNEGVTKAVEWLRHRHPAVSDFGWEGSERIQTGSRRSSLGSSRIFASLPKTC